jgi:hypothetical protein
MAGEAGVREEQGGAGMYARGRDVMYAQSRDVMYARNRDVMYVISMHGTGT